MAILDHIYEAATDDEAFAALPGAMAQLLGARSCVIMGFDDTLRLRAAVTSYFAQEMIDHQLAEDFQTLDIWTQYGAHPDRIGRVNNGADVWDVPEFLRSPFFNECIRAFGDDTVHNVGTVMRGDDGYMSIAVHSGLGSQPFDAGTCATLQTHVPHLYRMLELRNRLALARAKGDLLQHILDETPGGVLAVDRNLRVHTANAAATAILRAGDGLRIVAGRLVTTDERLQDRLANAVRSAACWTGARGDAILVRRAQDRPAYHVLVSPLPGRQPAALVIVDDPARRDPGLAASLTSMFGVTAAEAELAVLLAEGMTPEEAAEARDVRLNTVRTQIKSLLGKTDARRLIDLVRLLARVPRRP